MTKRRRRRMTRIRETYKRTEKWLMDLPTEHASGWTQVLNDLRYLVRLAKRRT